MFVDGENLVARYQDMVKAGATPKNSIRHLKDVYVWSDEVSLASGWLLNRISYYTVVVASADRIVELEKEIKGIQCTFSLGTGYLNPHIFSKGDPKEKTKSVDINLVTDVLRHAYNGSVDEICILSGDGDFLPTIRDVMRQGVRVTTGAFSSGLNPAISTKSDEFLDLDKYFFVQ